MLHHKNSCIIICFLFAFLFYGCEFQSQKNIKLTLPSNPFITEWRIEYPEKIIDGRAVFACKTVKVKHDREGPDIGVKIARGVNLPVLAGPVFQINDDAVPCIGGYPAGAVYPADIDGCHLHLSWENGFACEIIKSCLLNSNAVTAFDTVRFRTSLHTKAAEFEDSEGEKLPGGCWLVDSVPVLSRMGYGLFRESSIKAADTMTFSIPASGGSYQADNMLYPITDSSQNDGNYLLNVIIPVNRKTLFFNTSSTEVIEVYFDEKSWCWVNLITGFSESGRM